MRGPFIYLDKIILDGFKSFYSRTEIKLESGIIGIVGPNGCGKSNIYDAVQWVLGEQSAKQLRGEEISDVIARGNVRRAAKNTAEAYLTFEECQDTLDTDRDQIEVGRKVDMDGQGTYFLNGEEVRLKDVQNLFRDTGIGQDLYSSIGQGEVLNLIESKPEERREIIEEAAGIASYRHRRDLTQRRLEQTRSQLQQVEKDLREKKGRLSQLQSQAEKAEEVRELQSELRCERLNLARRDYRIVHEKLNSLDDKLDENMEKLRDLKTDTSEIADRKSRLQSLQQSVESKLNRLESLADPVQHNRQERREKRSEFRTRLDSLREQRKREQNNIKQLRRQHRSELNGLSDSYENLYRAHLRRKISEVELDVLSNREERLIDNRRELQNRREHLREKSLFKQTEIREIERELETHKEDLGGLRTEIRNLREELASLGRKAGNAAGRLADARTSYFHAESNFHELRYRNLIRDREQEVMEELSETLTSRKNELRNRINRLEKRHESLNGRIESRDGIPEGSRRLVESDRSDISQHLEGLLAEHLEVEESAGTAVEAVLGERLQDVLVRSEDSIRVLWEELEDHPVRLRPLRNWDETNNESSSPPGATPLRSFVKVDGGVEHLVDRLLSGVYLVEELSDLLKDRLSVDDERTYVDPKGNLRQSDGTISFREGQRQGGGLLRWKQERARVDEEQEEAQNEFEVVEEYLNRARNIRERIERQHQQIEGSLQGLRNEIRNNRETIREASHEKGRVESLIQDKLDVLRNRQVRRFSVRNKLRAGQSIQELVKNRGTDRTETIQKLEDQVEVLDGILSGLRTDQRSAEQKRSVAESRLRESESRITERNDRLKNLVENTSETREHRSELDRQRLQTQRSLCESRLALKRTKEELATFEDLRKKTREQRDELSETLDEVNEELREREKTIEQVRGTIDKTESERSNQQARRDELVEKIKDELEIEPVEKILEIDESDSDRDRSTLASRVRTLKTKIRDRQPVNMLASEEADELEQEVTEVQNQYDDLQDSCDQLESLIDRLNDKAREQFREAFDEIQDYFEDHIEELFQGGHGTMELTDGPVLKAGVKFEIEPPGEQLRSMSALSGGEKTLGALAFLFALYERKSTPFCFLDEVDHPLDDENVHQFIHLLSSYRDKTQFIVITHNKLTMQATDKLFGVTMEESGVTSIVPMELEDAEDLRDPQEVG